MITADVFKQAEDGYVHVVPTGECYHASEDVTQVFDEQSLNAMLANFSLDAAKPNFAGLLVDEEHWSYTEDRSTRALAWIIGLVKRQDGLWAKVRWTKAGREAMETGALRFVSPTFLRRDCQIIGERRIRPMRLDTVALTNAPALKTLNPITNSLRSNWEPDIVEEARAQVAEFNQRETLRAKQIHNRARELIRESGGKLSFRQAWQKAQDENADPLMPIVAEQNRQSRVLVNRALDLRAANPRLTLNDALQLARNEFLQK